MTVDEVYSTIKYIINDYQDGNVSPDELVTIIRYGSNSYQSFLIGQVEQQPNGRPIPRVGLGNNDKIYQSLLPFISAPTPISVNSSGVAVIPTDFQVWINMSTSDEKDIRFVQKDSWNNWKNSIIDPVSTNPIYTIHSTGFLFAPTTLGSAVLTYIKKPNDVKWAFTIVNGQEVYDPANSVDPQWGNKEMINVIARGLKAVGVNIQSAAVEGFANSIINSGQ